MYLSLSWNMWVFSCWPTWPVYRFNNNKKKKKKHLAQLCAVIKCWVCVVSIVSIHWVISSAHWRITQQLNPSALGRFPLSPDIWMDHTIISPALKPYAQWLFCLQTSLTGKISNHHGESRCFSFPAFLFFPFFPSPEHQHRCLCTRPVLIFKPFDASWIRWERGEALAMSFFINQRVKAATKFDSYLSELPGRTERHAQQSQIFTQTIQ